MPLSTQECKWVPTNCWGNQTNCWEVTCDGLAPRPGGVEILLDASCYGATWLGRLTFSRLVFAIAVASLIVDPAYRYCPKCGTEVFRVASSTESTSNSTEPPDSLKTRKFSLPSFKSYKAKKLKKFVLG